MEKNASNFGGFPGEKNSDSMDISDPDRGAEDHFYEKLVKLNESSGLSLVFNFRDTKLDLQSFYKEVIKRGGFYQVTKIGKWEDVASASNLNSSVPMSASQLQNVYEILLLQYELMYCRKISEKANVRPDNITLGVSSSFSTGKRKHCDRSSLFSTIHSRDQDNYTMEEASEPKTTQKNSTMITLPSSNVKEFTMDPDAPLKPRTGYTIFIRLETHRLRMIHRDNSNSLNLREMAINAWKCLPEKEKQPYLEASKMDKERYEREMATYKKLQNNQNAESQSLHSNQTQSMLNITTSSETDDVYHVSLEADSENFPYPDESKVGLENDVMKNDASKGSLDAPYEMNDDWTFY